MIPCVNGATTMPYPLEEDIRSASAGGFPAVEIWAGKLDAYLARHSLADLGAAVRDAGLSVAALCPYSLQMFGEWRRGLDGVERGIEVAHAVGSPLLLVCPDAPPQGMDAGEALKWAGERARVYGDAAQAGGVRLAVEPLGGHPFVPGPRQAMALIDAAGHPALSLMMDTFHYHKSRVPEIDVEAVPPALWSILHVNDVPGGPPEGLSDADRLYPGEGVLPLGATLSRFARAGYVGPVSVEVFRREYWELPIDEIVRRSFAGVAAALREAGAPR